MTRFPSDEQPAPSAGETAGGAINASGERMMMNDTNKWGPWIENTGTAPDVPGHTPCMARLRNGAEASVRAVRSWTWGSAGGSTITHYRLPKSAYPTTDTAIAALLAAGWTQNADGNLFQPDPDEAMRPYVDAWYEARGSRASASTPFDIQDRKTAKAIRAVLDLYARGGVA